MAKILVADDEQKIREVIREAKHDPRICATESINRLVVVSHREYIMFFS